MVGSVKPACTSPEDVAFVSVLGEHYASAEELEQAVQVIALTHGVRLQFKGGKGSDRRVVCQKHRPQDGHPGCKAGFHAKATGEGSAMTFRVVPAKEIAKHNHTLFPAPDEVLAAAARIRLGTLDAGQGADVARLQAQVNAEKARADALDEQIQQLSACNVHLANANAALVKNAAAEDAGTVTDLVIF